MQFQEINCTNFDKKCFISGTPSFNNLSKEDLTQIIADFEADISNYFINQKQKSTKKVPP